MDVTQEVRKNHIVYGASDYTAPSGLAASRSLNYAEGATITKPAEQECSVIPHTFRYQDSVGLFGAENYFTRVKLNIIGDVVFACYEEEGWQCANISNISDNKDPYYEAALVDRLFPCVDDEDGYMCPDVLGDSLPDNAKDPYVSIDLKNLKTGNKFVDDWLDIRLYTRNREEHPYDKMWVKVKDFFYIGFHARNTKRLPFDVACIIGLQYANYEDIPDKRMIMKR